MMTETQNADRSFVRTMTFSEVCEEQHGHAHEVDHFMTVKAGRIRVTCCQPDDRRIPIGDPVELTPDSQPFLVKAPIWHTWKALEVPCEVHCTFPNGERQIYKVEAGA